MPPNGDIQRRRRPSAGVRQETDERILVSDPAHCIDGPIGRGSVGNDDLHQIEGIGLGLERPQARADVRRLIAYRYHHGYEHSIAEHGVSHHYIVRVQSLLSTRLVPEGVRAHARQCRIQDRSTVDGLHHGS